ncbi:MAG: hypothetical protein ACFCU3_06910, partial [Verrucomicrobiales bacterium]
MHFFFRLVAILLLPATALLQSNSPAAEPVNSTLFAEVVFDHEPVEKGIVFDRAGAEQTIVETRGREDEAWAVQNAHGGDQGHLHTFRFEFTDDRFRSGDYESLDIEIVYLLDAFGSVRVSMETPGGVREVGKHWGVTKGNWRTRTVRVNNALLNRGVDGTADFRITGENGPLTLRSIRVTGYHSSKAVDWNRMLEVGSSKPINSTAEPVFLFRQGQSAGIRLEIRNHAKITPPLSYELRIRNDAEEAIFQNTGKVEPPGRSIAELELEFDTLDWAYGPYRAEISFFSEGGTGSPVFATHTLLGVISDAEIGKARPGEFLFGLDAGGDPTSPDGFAYYRLMGVDFLRGPGINSQEPKLAEIRERIAALYAEGVTSILVIDPPGQMKSISEQERKEQLAILVKDLEEIAREMKDKVTYYELGNEPDLPFFYPGSIESYHDSFVAMSKAIKSGNPDALVMNGGLCFFGEEGDRRAREFVAMVDMDHLDIWAYHGHGPGARAERDAYNRQVEAAKPYQKREIPYLDTETGFS